MEPTRRQFLAGAAAAAAGVYVNTRRSARASANERIGVALIGCGGRGRGMYQSLIDARDDLNLDFPAVCDVWLPQREAAADYVEDVVGSRPQTFARHQDLLELDEVDAVFIATPDHTHSPIGIDAANAGKHLFVEKPMAHRLEDANAIVDAVEANGVVCQVGTQRRSSAQHAGAARFIQEGGLGTIVKCECSWNRNVPSWDRPYNDVREDEVDWEQFLGYHEAIPFDPRRFRCWHLYRDYALGLVNLLGSHLIDIAQWYTDDPYPVSAVGMEALQVFTDRENADQQEIILEFPKGHVVRFESRLNNAYNWLGAENVFSGTKGVLDTSSWTARGDGGIVEERLGEEIRVEPAEDVTGGILSNWITCIRENRTDTHAPVHAGHAHSIAAMLGYQAAYTGRKHVYDPEARSISEA